MSATETGIVASVTLGEKIVKIGFPFILGAAVGIAIMIAWAHGCSGTSDKAILAQGRVYAIADSLASLKQDSAARISTKDSFIVVHDTIEIARLRKIYLAASAPKDSAECIAALRECDSLAKALFLSTEDAQRYAESRDIIIGLQANRIEEYYKSEKALLDSLSKIKPPFELPKMITTGLDLKLGTGFGSALAFQLEGYLSYKHWGIFVQAAIAVIKSIFAPYIVGGAVFHF